MSVNQATSGGISDDINITLDSSNTANRPSINFKNDLNTGIFQVMPESISVALNGTEAFRFTEDGIKNGGGTTAYGVTNPDFTNGTVTLYVNSSDLNCSDNIINTGGSITKPFRTIERALLEAARRSYVIGSNTDKFESYTIQIFPGSYELDNRPGVRSAINLPTAENFENELYKFNPKSGGVIVPRGTSLIGMDLRKTVIRPKYVPDPTLTVNAVMYDAAYMIEQNRGYIQEQTFLFIQNTFTANVNSNEKCKRDIGYIIDAVVADLRDGGNTNSFVAGEFYVNGLINQYITAVESPVATAAFDNAKTIMVAALNNWVGILGTYAEITVGKTVSRKTFSPNNGYLTNGDCSSATSAVTDLVGLINGIINAPSTYYTLYDKTAGVNEQVPIFKLTGGCYISLLSFKDAIGTPYKSVSYTAGIPAFTTATSANYSHHRVVGFAFVNQRNSYSGELTEYYKKIDAWDTLVDNGQSREVIAGEYRIVGDVQSVVLSNTVASASPYIFNCSLRSAYGMCGVYADGDAVADGCLKSMVMAQFTNVSLQNDTNAFIADANDLLDGTNYKESYKHYAYKGTNDAYFQLVSCFAIGDAIHYYTKNGAEFSITNSCSNFGGVSLLSEGNSRVILPQDTDYNIVKIIPPKVITNEYKELIIGSLNTDVLTANTVGTASLLNIDPIVLINSSYIYTRVPDPSNPTQQLDLQARFVAAGDTRTGTVLNVVDVNSSLNRNAIYRYVNCIGVYRYESVWYNSSNPPIGGLAAAEAAEIASRKAALNNANLFVQRIQDVRTLDDRNYHLLVSCPNTSRPPTINYVLSQLTINSLSTDKYFIGKINELTSVAITTPFTKNYKVTILRVNQETGKNSDLIEDIDLTNSYKDLLSNIDPRLVTSTNLIELSSDSTNINKIALNRFLVNFGYSVPQINTMLTPNNTYNPIISINGTVNLALVGDIIKFDLLRPSLIRCSGHTWEYVGYRNYSTGLPKLQQNSLSIGVRLASIQTTQLGGVIYATGMDELGNVFQGRNVTNIASNVTSTIRFDGLQQTTQNQNNASNNFANINVTGLGNINNIKTSNITLGSLNFQSSSVFKLDSGGVLSNLTQTNTPNGIKANSTLGTYGLVKHATNTELISRSGDSYLAPPDLVSVDADIANINSLIANLNISINNINNASLNNVLKTTDQNINGIKTFLDAIRVPTASNGTDAVNLNQLNSILSANSTYNITQGCLKIGGLQLLFGSTYIYGQWQASGAVEFSVSFYSGSPSKSDFIQRPVVFVETERLLLRQVAGIDVNGFSGYLDSSSGNISQPDNTILDWLAIGYI